MIDHGLQHPVMVELLKKALVDEALASAPTDRSSTDTRIALQTGLHRKDVRRLREEPVPEGVAAPMVPMAANVVARWISEPRFLKADKTPLPLARTPRLGHPGEPDFPTLVAEVSRDVGARAVLDELLRMGVVSVSAEGMVLLKDTAFVPQEGLGDSFHFLAENVGDHLAAAAFNLSPDRQGPPLLEQSAFSSELSADQAQELQRAARRLWADVLQQFLMSATVAEQRSSSDSGPKQRVRFGVYFHQAISTPSLPAEAAQPARRHKKKPTS
ncbi:hypothetical protein H010_08186 [Hydrogenophaga taeniospiralis CCUG 15921]|uniref:Uncharacterized protein n=2 Tax=Hydrogenophaga TaxID=47420 RepID=A0A9X4NRC3_9BURK|nr:hypothetical protein [Hydrogenophaga taeniospiralis CCUG 15921]